MAINYARLFHRRATPQSQPIPGSTQVPNSAGGYAWQVDDWTRFDRFLILGAEGGTYYIGERDLVKENHGALVRCIQADGLRAVNRIVEISESGRAPKNDPAIFALALVAAHGHAEAKALAFQSLAKVCRIGTHLFHFAEYVNALRGWGRGLRNAVGSWYVNREADELARQVVKYQQRDRWSHGDLLRLAHPKAPSRDHETVFRWILSGADGLGERTVTRRVQGEPRLAKYAAVGELPALIHAFEQAKKASSKAEIVKLITEHDLPREAIPTQWLDELEVWDALAAAHADDGHDPQPGQDDQPGPDQAVQRRCQARGEQAEATRRRSSAPASTRWRCSSPRRCMRRVTVRRERSSGSRYRRSSMRWTRRSTRRSATLSRAASRCSWHWTSAVRWTVRGSPVRA